MPVAGELTQAQTALLFAHMPGVGFSVADEEGVVRFWAGDAFSTCSPKLIGRSLFDCHPKRAHAAIESLLADLKSGKKDQVDTMEHGETARSASSTRRCAMRTALTAGSWRPWCRSTKRAPRTTLWTTRAKPEPNATNAAAKTPRPLTLATAYRFSLECEKMPSTTVAGRRPDRGTREGDASR